MTQLAAKKSPQRTCLGCRTTKNKEELIRVVRTKEREIVIDFKERINGRGAYLCKNPECLKRALKSNALGRSLKTEIPKETAERLREVIEN